MNIKEELKYIESCKDKLGYKLFNKSTNGGFRQVLNLIDKYSRVIEKLSRGR